MLCAHVAAQPLTQLTVPDGFPKLCKTCKSPPGLIGSPRMHACKPTQPGVWLRVCFVLMRRYSIDRAVLHCTALRCTGPDLRQEEILVVVGDAGKLPSL